eukprot:TRINITY_DN25993_c0_g1_i1.p1 TRINITY_DN25993_c0_g1~~TRINITY_DN25993_c0_g1_i1.p1  ORF type:complete len:130 (-),score=41.98 TRINITY_DN25993_c0_g1_i1:64-399(-)
MLRSLVGSEMCIRDSTHTGHHKLLKTYRSSPVSPTDRSSRSSCPSPAAAHLCSQQDQAGPQPTCSTFPSHTQTQSSRLCLLYTSDAADEEDSVDLGGRRIIKKKKKGVVVD